MATVTFPDTRPVAARLDHYQALLADFLSAHACDIPIERVRQLAMDLLAWDPPESPETAARPLEMLSEAPVGMFVTDSGGECTYANREFLRLSAMDAPTLYQDGWLGAVDPQDRASVSRLWRRTLDSREIFTAEFRFAAGGQEPRWVLAKAAPCHSGAEGIVGYAGTVIDIQRRKRAEAELKRAKEYLQALYDTSPDMVFLHDFDGRVIDVNDNTVAAYGYSREELVQLPIDQISGAGYTLDMAKDMLARALEGEPLDFEWVAKRRNGEEFPVEVRLRRLPAGSAAGEVLAVVRDISARKRIEAALRQSEERFRNLVEASTDLLWEVDDRNIYTYVSPQIHSLLGYYPEEIIGTTPFALMPQHEAQRVRAAFEEIKSRRSSFECIVNVNLHRDGHEVVLETSGVPFYDSDNRLRGYRGIDRDITARRHAEQEQASAFYRLECLNRIAETLESTLDMDVMLQAVVEEIRSIFRSDRAFLLTPCNPDAESWQVPFESTAEAFPGASAQGPMPMESSMRATIRELLDAQGPVIYDEGHPVPCDQALKESFDIQSQMMTAMYPKLGEPWVLGLHQCAYLRQWTEDERTLFEDIVHRVTDALSNVMFYREAREAHRRLSETQTQLLQSEKMASIGQLAAGVAHEINNPIGYISSNTATLKGYLKDVFELIDAYEQVTAQAPTDGESRQALEAVKSRIDLPFIRQDIYDLTDESHEGVLRVKQIVKDLKDFSRVDTDMEFDCVDLRRCIEGTLNIVWNEIKYKAEVVQELEDVAEVECVASQISQVLMNLLVNAGQAIETQGIITIRLYQENPQRVVIEVADTGKGIDADYKHKLFDPFFTTKPVGEGTGLGLSISFNIIEKHKGSIEVESEPGKGSTFRISLPVSQK